MDAIITLLGLVIGTIIFFAVMQNVKAIVYSCSSVCITFGMGGFTLTNLISKIGVDVKKVKDTKNLWNDETDKYITDIAEKADKIILAWGKFCSTHNSFGKREEEILKLLKPFKDKVYQICDESGREFLHPLTPAVRNGFTLKEASTIFEK